MLQSARRLSADDDSSSWTNKAAKPTEDFEDVGAELAKDAKIWKIYVEESDRSDKEIVDGWNGSLDVLLLFAALFSATTTALVIESSKQLQEDPAKVSAQTLLIISQNLIALSDKQPVSALGPLPMNSSFSPSRSSVLVNTLWFFSLSLSVIVSLIAILSKSWCYSFMSGRSGPKYEQARRRQQRWDGIKTWKMRKVITYLPVLMHCALLSFIIGLCIYLWSINVRVALPVLVLTAAFIGFYTGITVIPLVYKFCPYSTPASNLCLEVARIVKPPLLFILVIVAFVLAALPFLIFWLAHLWVSDIPGYIPLCDFLEWLFSQYPTEFSVDCSNVSCANSTGSGPVPPCWTQNASSLEEISVDRVTCRMLDWLITYSEDTNCVDLALQSIAGAHAQFSDGYLLKKAPVDLILERLNRCFWMNSRGGTLRLKNTSSVGSMLQYCRAFSCLAASYANGLNNPSFQEHVIGELGMVLKFSASLFIGPEFPDHTASASVDHAAFAASAFIPLSHWAGRFCSDGQARLKGALEQFTRLIQLHIDRTAVLHPGALLALVEASPHWAIEYLPELSKEDKSHSLSLLVQLLYSPDCATPQFEYSIGLALTLATVVMRSPHGRNRWSNPRSSWRDRVLGIYSALNAQGLDITPTLVAFGLLGLLDRSNGCSFSNSTIDLIAGAFVQIKQSQHTFPSIYTMEHEFDIASYAISVFTQYLHLANTMRSELYETAATVCILHPWRSVRPYNQRDQLYVLAIKAFSNTQSDKLQSACVEYLDHSQQDSYDLCSSKLAQSFSDPNDFVKLLQISVDYNSPFAPAAMYYLWSIVSRIFEVKRADELSIFGQMLKHEAFTSCQTWVSRNVSSPQNIHQIGFVHIWYPLLSSLRDDNAIINTVNKSRILSIMAESYVFSDMGHAVSPNESTWLKELKTLDRVYKSKARK